MKTDTGLTFQAHDAIRWFLQPFDAVVIASGRITLMAGGVAQGEIPYLRTPAFILFIERPGNLEWERDYAAPGRYRRRL